MSGRFGDYRCSRTFWRRTARAPALHANKRPSTAFSNLTPSNLPPHANDRSHTKALAVLRFCGVLPSHLAAALRAQIAAHSSSTNIADFRPASNHLLIPAGPAL